MNTSRPAPAWPLFLQPGQDEIDRPAPETVPALTAPDEFAESGSRRCELPGCENPLPEAPGNEDTIRYCCQTCRRSARGLRSRSRHDGQR